MSANIAEGFGRPTAADRSRFYSYALGSAREARDWYFKSRLILGTEIAEHRMRLTVQIIRQLINLQKHHNRTIQETTATYPI